MTNAADSSSSHIFNCLNRLGRWRKKCEAGLRYKLTEVLPQRFRAFIPSDPPQSFYDVDDDVEDGNDDDDDNDDEDNENDDDLVDNDDDRRRN